MKTDHPQQVAIKSFGTSIQQANTKPADAQAMDCPAASASGHDKEDPPEIATEAENVPAASQPMYLDHTGPERDQVCLSAWS